MAIHKLFSERQADAAKAGKADVYQYDEIPKKLRVQVNQISIDGLGVSGIRGDGIMRGNKENNAWTMIEYVFLREKGMVSIYSGYFAGDRIQAYMHECPTDDWLDILELIAQYIIVFGKRYDFESTEWIILVTSGEAINEINYRMREAGVGFQIEYDGEKTPELIRVDSQYVHAEVVKPALSLLAGEGFDGPRDEFLKAHQHYRAGEHRQAVAFAANAVESTFKAIFDQKGWEYQKGARLPDLVKVGHKNGLWPDYLDKSFDQLVATLQSGLPEIRNNDASHGQGAKPKEVPGYVAGYALHLAASNIVFIAEAAKQAVK